VLSCFYSPGLLWPEKSAFGPVTCGSGESIPAPAVGQDLVPLRKFYGAVADLAEGV